MNFIFIFIGFLIGNAVFGAAVWVVLEYEDQRLFKWYVSAEKLGLTGSFVQFLTLHLWPIGLWLWWKNLKP